MLFGMKLSPRHSTSSRKLFPFREKFRRNEVVCPIQNACLARPCHFGCELNEKICVFHRWINRIFISNSLKSDIDECTARAVNPCDAVANSECKNTDGSYECQCKYGFVMVGNICEGIM